MQLVVSTMKLGVEDALISGSETIIVQPLAELWIILLEKAIGCAKHVACRGYIVESQNTPLNKLYLGQLSRLAEGRLEYQRLTEYL